MTTYPEMNEKIVGLLRFRGNHLDQYAADRIEELEAEATRLLEQAQRAEAEVREAVARSAALLRVLDEIDAIIAYTDTAAIDWPTLRSMAADAHSHPSTEAKELLEHLAELETQVADLETDLSHNAKMMVQQCDQAMMRVAESADLRGALQAALLPLERAADALVPPGARVEEAAALVDDALVALREELE